MSEPAPTATPDAEPTLDPKVAYAFCRLAGGYWSGPTGRYAWFLTLGLALFLALSTAATVALNQWNRWFFDALEKKDVAAVTQAMLTVTGIVAVMAAIGVGIVLTRETLQIRWRAWLIDRLLERWLGERRFYDMNATRTEPANPEYRIADDTRWATEPLTDLGIGLVIAVLNAVAFISILWSVGGSYTLKLGGGAVTVPAYMVIVALAYGILMSALMMWIGRPLPHLVYAKNEREGDFRFALMRLRENAESVALMSGEKGEHAVLGRLFDRVVGSWLRIVRRHGAVTWITNSSGPLIPIVPLLAAAPKYLAGDLTLGQVTQLAGAFIAVQGAISWMVDNFNRIAEWYASARRVMDIFEACDAVDRARADAHPAVTFAPAPHEGVRISGLAVADPFGVPIIGNATLTARAGSSTFIAGDTSIGKSTLVRAVSGLWRRGQGAVHLPPGARVMIVPQKPYMSLGTLRETLQYPEFARPIADSEIAVALERVGLAHLREHLGEAARWDQRLSNGERQRLAIARIMVQRPDIVFLDDAMSALDAQSQAAMLAALRACLPRAAIIGLGQTEPASGTHDQSVTMRRQGALATLEARENENV